MNRPSVFGQVTKCPVCTHGFVVDESELFRVATRAIHEIVDLTGGDCGCNGTPPLCVICDLQSVVNRARNGTRP